MKTTHNTFWAVTKSAGVTLAMVTGTAALMAACTSVAPPPKPFAEEMVDPAIAVPAGNVVALETTATGLLVYECKANTPTAGMLGWALVSPQADLVGRDGKSVVAYSGPPATWKHMDGSSVVGSQVTIAPRIGAGNLPLQLSKGTPGAMPGVLSNVTYIQRIKTKGGQDFGKACTQTDIGARITLPYQADYIFWKAA